MKVSKVNGGLDATSYMVNFTQEEDLSLKEKQTQTLRITQEFFSEGKLQGQNALFISNRGTSAELELEAAGSEGVVASTSAIFDCQWSQVFLRRVNEGISTDRA